MLIILLMLMVPVSLIAKDVGWTINKQSPATLTLNMGIQYNQTATCFSYANAEPLNILLIRVNAPSNTSDILLYDKIEKTTAPLYLKPPLLLSSLRYNQLHHSKTYLSAPDLYPKRL